jgi:protein-tyrosine phosphatase
LAALNQQDQQMVFNLGIATIVDLRSSRERKAQPSRLHPDARPRLWSHEYDTSGGDLVAYLMSAKAQADTAQARMEELYRTLLYEQAPGYRCLFQQLATGPLPLLFHCAAGKDRTGIAAALLLELLGVSRGMIIEDYGITNLFFEEACTLIRLNERTLATIDPSILDPVMRALPTYIQAMFETLDANHGSIEAYFLDVLDIDSSLIANLRKRLLH